jgi:ABC-2 type transport system permease protein
MRFLSIFQYHLRSRLIQIIGWGGSLSLLAIYLVLLHDAFISQQEQFSSMMSAYPPELMAAFGGTADLFIPSGFLNFTFFSYAAVLLGFLAIAMGSSLLAADEERGRLDLIAAYPVSRLSLFTARLTAILAGVVMILVLSWAGFVVTKPGTGLEDLSLVDIALPHLELFALMLFFIGLALFFSQVLPARSTATALASAILLASYILKILLELDDNLEKIERFSPLHYIKGGYAIEGLNAAWMAGLLLAGLLFILLAAWRFERRDLRVSGEGNWSFWPRFGKKVGRS